MGFSHALQIRDSEHLKPAKPLTHFAFFWTLADELGERIMPTGTVKWFNNAKGYGFIVPEEGGEDLFAHFSAVNMDGYKTLSAGDPVQFEVTVGDKGPQATDIVPIASGA